MTFRTKRLIALGCFVAVAIGLAYLPAGEGFCNPRGFSDVPYAIFNIVAFGVLGTVENVFSIQFPEECPAVLHLVAITNLALLALLIFLVVFARAIAGCFPSSAEKNLPTWLAFAITFAVVFIGILIVLALVWS